MNAELEMYARAYPHARTALESLQSILDFQAAQAARVGPGPLVSLETARARWQAGLPLLDGDSFAVSGGLVHDALMELRPLLSRHAEAQVALDRLLASGLAEPSSAESLAWDLSRRGRERIEHLAASLSVDPEMLAFVLHTAIAPFYRNRALHHRKWLDDLAWRHGYCPVCGSDPSMARLAKEDGRRLLICSLCRAEWPFDRLRCPFCEADGPPQLRHFSVDGDSVHRVDCCEQCHGYLKSIDERRVGYPIHTAAEEVVTASLDALARELGYQ